MECPCQLFIIEADSLFKRIFSRLTSSENVYFLQLTDPEKMLLRKRIYSSKTEPISSMSNPIVHHNMKLTEINELKYNEMPVMFNKVFIMKLEKMCGK